MASWVQRMIGAAKLDAATYEDVEADRTANAQALGVVVLSSIATGIGGLSAGERGLLGGLVAGLVGWVAAAFLTYVIGAKMLPEPQTRADMGEMLRTLGFAASPGILRAFGWVPGIGGLIVLVAHVWMLLTTVVAVRQALDYTSTGRAVLVCVIGWFVNLLFWVWMAALLGIAFLGIAAMGR
jgi:hypothetical protein